MSQINNRKSGRTSALLNATVKFKGINNENWKEIGKTVSFSRSGAGFLLRQEYQPGRLISIMLPFPKHLRSYDEDKEFYRIWGLVQHCSKVTEENFEGFHIGVALIGKDAPAGYHENPAASYKICGMNDDGLWSVAQTAKPFVSRKFPRFQTDFDVWLELLDAEGENDFVKEKTVTENISVSGASVFSNLDVKIDDCINFTSKAHDFSALAVVRGKKTGERERPKIHLEFINAKFPVEKLVFAAKN